MKTIEPREQDESPGYSSCLRRSALVVLSLALGACAGFGERADDQVALTILALNDFHGSLEAPRDDYGGAAYLATHLRRERAAAEHSVTVSAGDLIGATPLISSLFHDEPTIEAANALGLDFHAVGNHEFDEGWRELLRMQHGGPRPGDTAPGLRSFGGARFRFLAANVVLEGGDTLFPPYAVQRFDGIPVAFIGLTLEGTPSLVTASGVDGLEFLDEARAINALVAEIRRQGIEAIVVVIHQGGYPADGGEDECRDFEGPIIDIVAATDEAVDLFVTGHTHRHYLCSLNGRPVTSAGSTGRWYTRIVAALDRRTGDLAVTGFDNVPVTQDVQPAADLQALVARYRGLVEQEAGRVVGTITADLTRARNEAGMSAIGALIADAQLAATCARDQGGAQVAFMNAGGIRNDFLFEPSGDEREGQVTYAELFAVHPFGNYLVTMSLTGAQIHSLLEQQWLDRQSLNVLIPSRGFSYAWSEERPSGERVDPASIAIDGVPVGPHERYRVTVNSFLAGGGDGFPVLIEGTDRHNGLLDIDALENYLKARSPIAPPPLDRIRLEGTGTR
jgi:5'-nucleotidase